MRFERYIQNEKVIRTKPDVMKARALIKTSQTALLAAQKIPLGQETAAAIVSTSYSALRQLLEAICLKQGLKIYSHEAFTAFLTENGTLNLAKKYDRFRKLRNGVEYYAKSISQAEADDSRTEIETLYKEISKKYLNEE